MHPPANQSVTDPCATHSECGLGRVRARGGLAMTSGTVFWWMGWGPCLVCRCRKFWHFFVLLFGSRVFNRFEKLADKWGLGGTCIHADPQEDGLVRERHDEMNSLGQLPWPEKGETGGRQNQLPPSPTRSLLRRKRVLGAAHASQSVSQSVSPPWPVWPRWSRAETKHFRTRRR